MNANLTITLNNMKVQIQMSVVPIKCEIYMNKTDSLLVHI